MTRLPDLSRTPLLINGRGVLIFLITSVKKAKLNGYETNITLLYN